MLVEAYIAFAGAFLVGMAVGSVLTNYRRDKELDAKDMQIAELLGKNRDLSLQLEEMDRRFQKEYE